MSIWHWYPLSIHSKFLSQSKQNKENKHHVFNRIRSFEHKPLFKIFTFAMIFFCSWRCYWFGNLAMKNRGSSPNIWKIIAKVKILNKGSVLNLSNHTLLRGQNLKIFILVSISEKNCSRSEIWCSTSCNAVIKGSKV